MSVYRTIGPLVKDEVTIGLLTFFVCLQLRKNWQRGHIERMKEISNFDEFLAKLCKPP